MGQQTCYKTPESLNCKYKKEFMSHFEYNLFDIDTPDHDADALGHERLSYRKPTVPAYQVEI